MNSTEINPTDILAQKRAEASKPAAVPSLNAIYWSDRLGTVEGRAAIFAEILDADLVGEGPPPPASDRDLWLWLGSRMRAARMLRDAMELAPLAVGAMWAEAMKREFERRTGTKP